MSNYIKDVLLDMPLLIVALVSFAIAFVAGLLLGKAYLRTKMADDTIPRDRYHKLLKMQRQKYRERVLSLHGQLRDQLKSEARKIATLTTREHQLEDSLATRDHQINDLETDLEIARQKTQKLTDKLDRWKQRVAPLAEKLREQQALIRRLQDNEESAPETGRSTDGFGDDLQQIRGIGPALERRLNNSGIHRFQQIAQMTEEQLASIAVKLAISPSLAARDGWIRQARELQKGDVCPGRPMD